MSVSTAMTESTMKAWQYNKFGASIEENMFLNNTAARPATGLAPDEVLVRVISASINPVDYKVAEASIARLAVSLPASPGLDYCGRVVASGNGVDTLVNGQVVFGRIERPTQFGTLGEFIVVTAPCLPLPSGVEPDHACSIGTAGLTAYQCIQPNVQKGSKVFINGGSGGCGCFGIQIAKALGCIVTVSCSTTNIGLCKELGADEVIDYKVSDVAEKLKAEGLVYDLVVDNVGTPDNLYVESTHFLRETGKFVQVGAALTPKSVGSMMSRLLKPKFLGGGTRKFQFLTCKNDAAAFEELGKVSKHSDWKMSISLGSMADAH